MKKTLAVTLFLAALFMNPGVASAESARWIDVSTIEYAGTTYFDNNPYDDDRRAEAFVSEECGYSTIEYTKDRTSARGSIKTPDEFAGCSSENDRKEVDITFFSSNAAFMLGYRQSSNEITIYRGSDGEKAQPSPLDVYRKSSNGGDPKYYFVNPDGSLSSAVWVEVGSDNKLTLSFNGTQSNIDNELGTDKLVLSASPAPSGVQVNNPSGSSPNETTNPDCESSGFSLSWVTCGLFNAFASLTDMLFENFIEPLLRSPAISIDSSEPIFKVWSSFRVIGNIVLLFGLLFIVFGQTIGGGMVDAYTAKKMAPRLIAAAVLINLSIYLVAIAVDVTNVIGGALGSLLLAPFEAVGENSMGSNPATGGVAFLAGGAASILAGKLVLGAAGSLASFIGLFILLPAALVAFAILLVLLLRRGLIILLIIISPVALALFVLPNTEKYFKQWWETLVKALLIYPIVVALFAISDILAITLQQGGSTSGAADVATDIGAFIAMLAPLFLIPFAFKLAGGVLGGIYGTVSNFGKRGSEAIKGNPNDSSSLRNKVKRNFAVGRTRSGVTFSQQVPNLNPRRITRAGRERARSRVEGARQIGLEGIRRDFENSNEWKLAQNDSNITGALGLFRSGNEARAAVDFWEAEQRAKGTSEHEIARQRQQKLAAIGVAEKIGYNESTRRAALLNPNTIGYEIEEGEKGWEQATGAMASIAGGSIQDGRFVGGNHFQFRAMMDEYQAIAKGPAGRADQAANVDGGIAYDGDRAWKSVGLYQHGNGKPRSIKGSGQYFKNLLDRANRGAMTETDIMTYAHLSEDEKQALRTGTLSLNNPDIQTRAADGAAREAAIFTIEMGTIGASATGAVRDEAMKQKAEFEALAGRGDDGGYGRAGSSAGVSLQEYLQDNGVRAEARGWDPKEAALHSAREASAGGS